MLDQYAHYQLSDFVRDEKFIRWVKHRDGENDLLWEQVQEAFPFQRENIRQAKRTVQQLTLASQPVFPAEDAGEIWRGIAEALKQEPNHEPESRSEFAIRGSRIWWKWAAVASILLVLGWGGWYGYKSEPATSLYAVLVKEAGSGMVEVVNREEASLRVQLPDGSTARLGKNSRLSYARIFNGNQREVFLSGEAFFEVTKDPSRPFLVYANELVTKVLGTSFHVRAFEADQQVQVAVGTGRVSVYEHRTDPAADPETTGLVLIPNQQAVYQREEPRLRRTLVQNPVVLKKPDAEPASTFTETPVAEIFRAIERDYGVDIVFDEEVLQSCSLTTTLGNESLYQKLDILCKGIDASYKVVDAQIVITSRGCP